MVHIKVEKTAAFAKVTAPRKNDDNKGQKVKKRNQGYRDPPFNYAQGHDPFDSTQDQEQYK